MPRRAAWRTAPYTVVPGFSADRMYIVAIAWLYVTLLVSVMQPTLFRGIVTFIGTGLGEPGGRAARLEA